MAKLTVILVGILFLVLLVNVGCINNETETTTLEPHELQPACPTRGYLIEKVTVYIDGKRTTRDINASVIVIYGQQIIRKVKIKAYLATEGTKEDYYVLKAEIPNLSPEECYNFSIVGDLVGSKTVCLPCIPASFSKERYTRNYTVAHPLPVEGP